MFNPLISVIIPSYNQSEFLEETILSIINQNYEYKEIIVIDGGSIDNSIEIIKKHESSIKYWISEKDSGQTEAINKGFKVASGEIVNWICSDDILTPGALSIVASHFQKNKTIDVLYGNTQLFKDNFSSENVLLISKIDLAFDRDRGIGKIITPQPSTFFKREILNKLGYLDEKLNFGMDYDLYLRIACNNYNFIGISDILAYYRLHTNSKTATSTKKFYADWNYSFTRFINSVEDNETYIKILKEVELYTKGAGLIQITSKFTKEQVCKSICYHISNGINHHYENLNFQYVRRITSQTRRLCPKIYFELKLYKFDVVAILLPIPLVKILRKILR